MIRVAPGVTLDYDIELSRAYDLSQSGRYTIEFVSRGANGSSVVLRSAVQAFRLDGRGASLTTVGPSAFVGPNSAASITALAAVLSYTKCTVTQQTQVATAVASAATYAAQAKSYMAGSLGARYTKWFGAVNTANRNKVTSNFTAIDDAFATKPVVVDCGCKKTYFAYVYSNQPYKIYLCKAFWSAPNTGTDSRAGTLVHEMSHFTVVAGTNDWAYGQTAAASLAITDVLKAISNADSHEYFAENTPILP
jgi:peptidyl-Lys metalloendopeptidase